MDCFLRYGLRLVIVAILMMNCVCLFGQVNVQGVIVDPDGAAVPDVDILLQSPESNTPDGNITTTADAAGHFHFAHVTPGDYELEIPAKYGFERYQAPVHIAEGVNDLRIRLTLSVVTENVTVASESNALTLDPATNRDQVSSDAKLLEKVPVFDQH